MRGKIENVLAGLDAELRYLMLLSERGLKPLSRWEGPFGRREEAAVDALGLGSRTIRRRLRGGDPIRELVFGRSPGYLELYARRLEGTRLGHTAERQRLEGFLFGYPSCCVESFIRYGYRENDLAAEDQELLFHWACRGCRITPALLGEYRRIWSESERLSWQRPTKPAIWRLGGGIAAAVAACFALSCTSSSATGPTHPEGHHRIEVACDLDGDGLMDVEELRLSRELGYNCDMYESDTDYDGVLDGVQLAERMVEAFDALDTQPSSTRRYKIEHVQKGIEVCEICGVYVNMGYVEVHSPPRDIHTNVPFIALHFMEFGSFSYSGSTHEGRVDAVRLGQALEVLPVGGDSP